MDITESSVMHLLNFKTRKNIPYVNKCNFSDLIGIFSCNFRASRP